MHIWPYHPRFPVCVPMDGNEISRMPTSSSCHTLRMTAHAWARCHLPLDQVKMQELLGDAWPQASAKPDVVRASVCCDLLG